MKLTERGRVRTHVGIARRAGMTATLTCTEWEQTLTDFNRMCAYCQIRPFTLLEHFHSVLKAGTHVKNCIPACDPCNKKKRDHTSDSLTALFGTSTIERIEQYLASRQPQPDPPHLKPRHELCGWSITPRSKPKHDDPYQLLIEVAKEMNVSPDRLRRQVKRTGIKVYKFIRDKRTYLEAKDVQRLKEIKEKPWKAGAAKAQDEEPSAA